MRPRPVRLVPAVLVLACGAAALVHARRAAPAEPAPGAPVLVPFLLEEARVLGVVAAQVLIANPGADGSALWLERLRVVSGGATLIDVALEGELPGDPRFARASALIERLPEHRARERWFAPAGAPALEGDQALAAWSEAQALLAELRADHAAGRPEPFRKVDLELALDQVFLPEDQEGARRDVEVRLDYVDAQGAPATLAVTRTLTRLAAPRGTPASLAAGGYAIHAGDLHVHSCHGEAVGACAPSGNCAAETLQTSGSFSYAQLKTQYQALGLDWITATDHSYCIDSDAEYAAVVQECAALTDAGFLAIADLELSSDEAGPQIGSDLGDLVCLGTTEANHMGAHGIETRKAGGSPGFLGFCDGLFGGDALAAFPSNAALVRADGGYPIVNHPAGSSFGWNSFAATQGIEASQMHGVEIWNGAAAADQAGNVARWVEWLLAGRVLYAYSGSDTHDAAFAFGATHALLQGPFTAAALESALKAGRAFVSNDHVLALEVDQGGATLSMGTLQALPSGAPAQAIVLRAHYDFGADQASITLYSGRVGDAAETALFSSSPLTGAGVLEVPATLVPSGRTWYRAESHAGAKAAYTNPVFFLPGSCAYAAYGAGLGGANVGALASASSPASGSVNVLAASFPGGLSGPVFYGASASKIAGGLPLLGGFLLIGPSTLLVAQGALTGGQGALAFQIPSPPSAVGQEVHWQAIAPDPSQPLGLAFTNGLSLAICAPFP